MKVYVSIIDSSYAESMPGNRDELSSIQEAKEWFRAFVNGYLHECPATTENAVLDLYSDQHSEEAFRRFSAGHKRNGEYTVKEEKG